MPPMVASAPGSTQKAQPVFASALFSCRCVTPGLDRGVEILGAHAQHAVHARQVDRHAAVDRVDVAFERAAGAERHDWRAVSRGDAYHRAHLVGRQGKYDHVWRSGRVPRFAVPVMFELRRVGGAAVAEQAGEIAHQRRPAIGGQD